MTPLRFEDVAPDAALFLALARGRLPAAGVPALGEATAAAAARTLDRDALADVVETRLRSLCAPPESVEGARALRHPRSAVVVAGQQPVLFGGPHMVVSKSLAAVAVARRLSVRTGSPVVPVFWVASEDHDHAEVDHVDLLRGDGAVETLSVTLPRDRRMLSRTPLDGADAFERLAAALPAGPGRDDALRAARPVAGEDVGAAFARVLLALVGRLGVVVVEPATMRPLARGVVRHEIERPGALAAAVVAAEESLAAAGFAKPLGLRGRDLFFVVDRKGRRHRPQLPGADDVAARATWLRRAEEEPHAFSWDVAGRVLAQDVALPVAAQVCGPAEMAYCAAVSPAHALLGVPAPALVARAGVTFVDAAAAAACRAAGVSAADVVAGRVSAAGADMLRPRGALQERSLSILPFLARRGSGILDDVLAAVGEPGAEHTVLDLGDA